MRCWRLTMERRSATAFDGEGARRAGGRWNSVGRPAVYTAEHLPLAALEILVHVDAADLVTPFVAIEIEIPDVLVQRVAISDLPTTWCDFPAPSAVQAFGDDWLQARQTLGLVVPSAIIPDYLNVIINPAHAAINQLKILRTQPFHFDPRLKK